MRGGAGPGVLWGAGGGPARREGPGRERGVGSGAGAVAGSVGGAGGYSWGQIQASGGLRGVPRDHGRGVCGASGARRGLWGRPCPRSGPKPGGTALARQTPPCPRPGSLRCRRPSRSRGVPRAPSWLPGPRAAWQWGEFGLEVGPRSPRGWSGAARWVRLQLEPGTQWERPPGLCWGLCGSLHPVGCGALPGVAAVFSAARFHLSFLHES